MELELDDGTSKPTEKKLVQTYKIISGNSMQDLENKVNWYCAQPGNEGYQLHGDVLNFGYSEFIQSLAGYKYVE